MSQAGAGAAARVLTAWADLRGATRAVLDARPSEGALLALAMLSGVLHFLGEVAGVWLGPEGRGLGGDEVIARIGAGFVGALIFRVLFLYLLAGAVWGIARSCGGTGSAYETRVAVFWAALVAAPVLLAADLAGVALAASAGRGLAALAGLASEVAFAVAFAHAVAEAHGFSRPWLVLAAVAVPLVALLGLLQFAGGGTP